MTRLGRLSALTTASLFALSLGVGAVLAAGEPDPPGARNPGASQTQKPASGSKESTGSKKKQKKSEQEFRDGYRARLRAGAGRTITKRPSQRSRSSTRTTRRMSRTISATRRASSATMSWRRYWYERALAADPKHVRTWQYYGMWQVEQGNMLKAAGLPREDRGDLRQQGLQGVPGPEGRHGRYCHATSRRSLIGRSGGRLGRLRTRRPLFRLRPSSSPDTPARRPRSAAPGSRAYRRSAVPSRPPAPPRRARRGS